MYSDLLNRLLLFCIPVVIQASCYYCTGHVCVILSLAAASLLNMAEQKKIPIALQQSYGLPESLTGVFKASCKHCGKSISGSTKVSTNWL